jgi:hypothetical protein
MTTKNMTVSTIEQNETGKGGEGGTFEVTNAEFVAAVFPHLLKNSFAAVCSKSGDPSTGGYIARPADKFIAQLSPTNNNFVGCSSFYPDEDDTFKARKTQFAACHFLMLDDLGTKVPLDRLADFELSWLIETSTGNFQGGIILAEPQTDGAVAIRLLNAVIAAGLCDAGATGPLSRWARLPVAINGKSKHADEAGAPFVCRLIEWRPEKRYTPQQIVDGLKLELAPAGRPQKQSKSSADTPGYIGNDNENVFTPKAAGNPVMSALKERGFYKTPLGSGKHDITCPWLHEHTDGSDNGTAYFEPDELHPHGGFCCQHSHRDKYHIKELLNFLEVRSTDAQHKSTIQVAQGDLHLVLDSAEKALSSGGRHYQSGGLIVTISTDPISGDPFISPVSANSLTRELSEIAIWEKFDSRKDVWVRCDPPPRHCSILYDSQQFKHLPTLAGLARQPYFRESDGELIMKAGYDSQSKLFGVFDPKKFFIPEPTRDDALEALKLLEELLKEFHFVTPADKAAAVSAICTAVVRPTLSHAPAYHMKAPVFGSGKSYLCEVIGSFAGSGGNAKVSYPTTPEEATKVILSLLLTNPAVIEFDDMSTDWLPHGTILRMLTAEKITDRILGVSKTATVSTRTLFLGSGNNVGPIRDLLRRVLTINIDPRCATPATIKYEGKPLETVQKNRAVYVAAVITMILAWKKAGSSRTDVPSIVTYSGSWSDYCRHPLIWLGLADPASSLIEQITHDPDGDALAGLMTEWLAAFGRTPTTVRRAVEAAEMKYTDLLDAMREFPVEEHGEINRSKMGWILKKNANRVVSGFEFQKSTADGRTAWRVVEVKPPPLTPLPPLKPQDAGNSDTRLNDFIEVEI